MSAACYWVYILHCSNDTYYTGYTTDVARRFQQHLDGTGSKYTRSFQPICVAQSWKITTSKASAMKVERYIKKLTKQQKQQLISHPELLSKTISY